MNKIKDVPATSFFPVQGNVTKKTEHERKERFMTRRELREQIFKLLFGVEFHDRQEPVSYTHLDVYKRQYRYCVSSHNFQKSFWDKR